MRPQKTDLWFYASGLSFDVQNEPFELGRSFLEDKQAGRLYKQTPFCDLSTVVFAPRYAKQTRGVHKCEAPIPKNGKIESRVDGSDGQEHEVGSDRRRL